MSSLIALQIGLFVLLWMAERRFPARPFHTPPNWNQYWLALQSLSLIWMHGFAFVWDWWPRNLMNLSDEIRDLPYFIQVIGFYMAYSFVNYWMHRIKHAVPMLWRYIHYLHHAPTHMETRLTLWRHPLEILFNSSLLVGLGALLLGVSLEVLLGGLILEGLLECWHHSNLRTPARLHAIAWVLQTPEMHLIHHQRGLHRYNYSPVAFWDLLFGTWRRPQQWQGKLGVRLQDLHRLVWLRY